LKMERLTHGEGPVLVGFYLESLPPQLWSGIMTAVAKDIDATALVFTAETWIGVFPNVNGEGEVAAKEWYENHPDLSEFPNRQQAIVVNLHRKDQASRLEIAMIDDEDKELGEFTAEYGREQGGDIKW